MAESEVLLDDFETPQKHLSEARFALLCVLTFGLYQRWWMYKSWKFIKDKDQSDIYPIIRSIFAIFFLYTLNEKILHYAKEEGYEKDYSSGPLFVGFLVFSFLGRLPDPFWIVSSFSFAFILPQFKAVMFIKQNTSEKALENHSNANGKQIAIIIVGIVLWALVILGLVAE